MKEVDISPSTRLSKIFRVKVKIPGSYDKTPYPSTPSSLFLVTRYKCNPEVRLHVIKRTSTQNESWYESTSDTPYVSSLPVHLSPS